MRLRLRLSYAASSLFLALALSTLVVAGESPKFEQDILAFESADKTNPPPTGAVLVIGSSSIRLWTNLAACFPEWQLINRGFGGSHMSDCAQFAERIAVPYRPALILVYAGENDIKAGKTPEEVLSDFRAFVAKVRAGLPRTPIGYIAIKPSPAREEFWPAVREANRIIQEYTRTRDRLFFIDVFTPMLAGNGQPDPAHFKDDHLHLTPAGYKVWADRIRPYLRWFLPPKVSPRPESHDAPPAVGVRGGGGNRSSALRER